MIINNNTSNNNSISNNNRIIIIIRNLKTQATNTFNNICQKHAFKDVDTLPSKNT